MGLYESTRERVEVLFHACWEGNLARVKEILAEGNHDVNGQNRWQVDYDPRGWRRSPLHVAAMRGDLELAKYLVDEGADLNARTKYADTPLHLAVENNGLELVKLLVARGADRTLLGENGSTPVELARKWNRQPLVEVLEQA